jgi:hypothetical protein
MLHHHHQAEIHHDPRAAADMLGDLHGEEAMPAHHHYTNSRGVVEDEYAQVTRPPRQQQPQRPLRSDLLHNPQAGLHGHRTPDPFSPPDLGTMHSHRADMHHPGPPPPRHMDMHADMLHHRQDLYRPEPHRQNLRVDVHSDLRGGTGPSPRTHMGDLHQDLRGRGVMDSRADPRSLPHAHPMVGDMHLMEGRDMPPQHHRSHHAVYDDAPSYGNDYTSRYVCQFLSL